MLKIITCIISMLSFPGPVTQSMEDTAPGIRAMSCLVYNEDLQLTVLVDGTYPGIQPVSGFTELWGWNGKNWSRLPGTGPQARYVNSAVYDPHRKKVISYGGRVGKKERISADTWEWDGKQWEAMKDSGIGPRDHQMMSYDVHRKRAVVFGGGKFPRTRPWATDTWEWDGNRWEKKSDAGPPGRVAAMVYDSKQKKTVLFGGVGEPLPDGTQPFFKDTWTWDGIQWRKKETAVSPPPRARHAMCYNSRSGKVILYGGSVTESGKSTAYDDMWQWDGENWTEIRQPVVTPGKRELHALCYDIKRDRVILYAGNADGKVVGDVWEWDGRLWNKMN
jgi:hypothetical protein